VVKGPHDDARIEIFGKVYSTGNLAMIWAAQGCRGGFLGEKVRKRHHGAAIQ